MTSGQEAHLVPGTQIDNYQIILNTTNIYLKIYRRNSTTKKKKVTIKIKVESSEIWLRGCKGKEE